MGLILMLFSAAGLMYFYAGNDTYVRVAGDEGQLVAHRPRDEDAIKGISVEQPTAKHECRAGTAQPYQS